MRYSHSLNTLHAELHSDKSQSGHNANSSAVNPRALSVRLTQMTPFTGSHASPPASPSVKRQCYFDGNLKPYDVRKTYIDLDIDIDHECSMSKASNFEKKT